MVNRILQTTVGIAGYEIVRVAKPRPTLHVQLSLTELGVYSQTTNSISGRIALRQMTCCMILRSLKMLNDILEIGSWQHAYL